MAERELYDNPWPANTNAGTRKPKSPTETIATTATNPWRSGASTSQSRRGHSPSPSLSSASSFGETDALTAEHLPRGTARPVQYRQGGTIGGVTSPNKQNLGNMLIGGHCRLAARRIRRASKITRFEFKFT